MALINFLHTFNPSPILFSLDPVHIYWYGFFIVLGVLSALAVAIYLAKFYSLKIDVIVDLTFWLIIGGIIGARLYSVLLEWPYFSNNPLEIFKIWQGGLAIHGAMIGGAIALWWFTKKSSLKENFWLLASIAITALPLAQAFGRWGNFFNQELFGRPTSLPWGIPINQANRPLEYFNFEYFQPTFLYESIGNLIIFFVLILLQIFIIKKNKLNNSSYFLIFISYFLLYSLLRFSLEFIRIDATPVLLGLRLPQIVSLLIVVSCLVGLALKFNRKIGQNSALEK